MYKTSGQLELEERVKGGGGGGGRGEGGVGTEGSWGWEEGEGVGRGVGKGGDKKNKSSWTATWFSNFKQHWLLGYYLFHSSVPHTFAVLIFLYTVIQYKTNVKLTSASKVLTLRRFPLIHAKWSGVSPFSFFCQGRQINGSISHSGHKINLFHHATCKWLTCISNWIQTLFF